MPGFGDALQFLQLGMGLMGGFAHQATQEREKNQAQQLQLIKLLKDDEHDLVEVDPSELGAQSTLGAIFGQQPQGAGAFRIGNRGFKVIPKKTFGNIEDLLVPDPATKTAPTQQERSLPALSPFGTNAPFIPAAPTAPTTEPQASTGTGTPHKYAVLAAQIAHKEGVPAQLVPYFVANVHTESGFDPRATSLKGAQGLGQLMPDTASDVGVTDAYDPVQNLTGSAKYFAQLAQRFGNDPEKTVAAYNAGPERVEAAGGVPPIRETQAHVKRVQGRVPLYAQFEHMTAGTGVTAPPVREASGADTAHDFGGGPTPPGREESTPVLTESAPGGASEPSSDFSGLFAGPGATGQTAPATPSDEITFETPTLTLDQYRRNQLRQTLRFYQGAPTADARKAAAQAYKEAETHYEQERREVRASVKAFLDEEHDPRLIKAAKQVQNFKQLDELLAYKRGTRDTDWTGQATNYLRSEIARGKGDDAAIKVYQELSKANFPRDVINEVLDASGYKDTKKVAQVVKELEAKQGVEQKSRETAITKAQAVLDKGGTNADDKATAILVGANLNDTAIPTLHARNKQKAEKEGDPLAGIKDAKIYTEVVKQLGADSKTPDDFRTMAPAEQSRRITQAEKTLKDTAKAEKTETLTEQRGYDEKQAFEKYQQMRLDKDADLKEQRTYDQKEELAKYKRTRSDRTLDTTEQRAYDEGLRDFEYVQKRSDRELDQKEQRAYDEGQAKGLQDYTEQRETALHKRSRDEKAADTLAEQQRPVTALTKAQEVLSKGVTDVDEQATADAQRVLDEGGTDTQALEVAETILRRGFMTPEDRATSILTEAGLTPAALPTLQRRIKQADVVSTDLPDRIAKEYGLPSFAAATADQAKILNKIIEERQANQKKTERDQQLQLTADLKKQEHLATEVPAEKLQFYLDRATLKPFNEVLTWEELYAKNPVPVSNKTREAIQEFAPLRALNEEVTELLKEVYGPGGPLEGVSQERGFQGRVSGRVAKFITDAKQNFPKVRRLDERLREWGVQAARALEGLKGRPAYQLMKPALDVRPSLGDSGTLGFGGRLPDTKETIQEQIVGAESLINRVVSQLVGVKTSQSQPTPPVQTPQAPQLPSLQPKTQQYFQGPLQPAR